MSKEEQNKDEEARKRLLALVTGKAVSPPKSEVGYGKPPKDGQFKKGQSGNLKGRPGKKDKPETSGPYSRKLLKEIRSGITIKEKGDAEEIASSIAVLKAQRLSALKGNAIAQKDYLNRAERIEQEEQARLLDRYEYWTDYAADYPERERAYREKGEEVPLYLPHPEDITFIDCRLVRIMGPTHPDMVPLYEDVGRFRDYFLLQAVYEERFCPEKAVGLNAALFLATSFNLTLPKRFRIEEIAFVTTTVRLEIKPKRELMKMIDQASLALGFEDTTYGLALPAVEKIMADWDIDPEIVSPGRNSETKKRYRAEPANSLDLWGKLD